MSPSLPSAQASARGIGPARKRSPTRCSRCRRPSRRRMSIHSSPSRLAISALPAVGREAQIADRREGQMADGAQGPARVRARAGSARPLVSRRSTTRRLPGRRVAAVEHVPPRTPSRCRRLPARGVERHTRGVEHREHAAVGPPAERRAGARRPRRAPMGRRPSADRMRTPPGTAKASSWRVAGRAPGGRDGECAPRDAVRARDRRRRRRRARRRRGRRRGSTAARCARPTSAAARPARAQARASAPARRRRARRRGPSPTRARRSAPCGERSPSRRRAERAHPSAGVDGIGHAASEREHDAARRARPARTARAAWRGESSRR